MPELPEVENVVRFLSKKLTNENIEQVIVNNDKFIKNSTKKKFIAFLENETIEQVLRRGKYIVFLISNNKMIISHLRMEGKYKISEDKDEPIQKHSHIIFLTTKYKIEYNDSRGFGTFEIYNDHDFSKYINIGPEPFSNQFSFSYLKKIFNKSTKNIKSILLDQKIVVGLGNIYVNEVLYSACISPFKKANELNDKEIHEIYIFIKVILEKAINEGGTTFSTFHSGEKEGNYQSFLNVYKKDNCIKCNTKIEKAKIAGRGTFYCSQCQF
ncbi:MAG: DNA-formamidopyrimidine glycosylase [Metamycoplasmataceae bacterium]